MSSLLYFARCFPPAELGARFTLSTKPATKTDTFLGEVTHA